MKTIKTIGLVALMMVVSSFTFANKGSVAEAKQNLSQAITKTIEDDMPKIGNYLYENQIQSIDSEVKIAFVVDGNQEVNVFRVLSNDFYAAEYVKNLLNKDKVKAYPVLTGKSFTMKIHVIFNAK